MEAIVSYKNQYASYRVIPEKEGVYNAQLVRFEGNPESAPPEEIVLMKGMRKWIGSCFNPDLINEIGRVIEMVMPPGDRSVA